MGKGKKIAGIIILAVSVSMFIFYLTNWVFDNTYFRVEEANIATQKYNISCLEHDLTEYQEALKEVIVFESVYGSNATTRALSDKYEDYISDAKTDIIVAKAKIKMSETNINNIRTVGGVIAFVSIIGAIIGIVLLVNSKKNTVPSGNISDAADEEEGWECPACGKINPAYSSYCSCGLKKG